MHFIKHNQQKLILDVICRGKVVFKEKDLPLLREFTFPELEKLAQDGLLTWNEQGMTVTQLGHYFLRNICKSFDMHLWRNNVNQSFFSKAI